MRGVTQNLFECVQFAAAWIGFGLRKASTLDRTAAQAGRAATSRTVAQRPAPGHEPTEAALHDPAAFEHDEASPVGGTFNDPAAQAVVVCSILRSAGP